MQDMPPRPGARTLRRDICVKQRDTDGFSWLEFSASLISTCGSLAVIAWSLEWQSNPSTTPPFVPWCVQHVKSAMRRSVRWIPKVTIPLRVSMMFATDRTPADDAEEEARATWIRVTGDAPKITAEPERKYHRVWITCSACKHRQAEWVAPGAATRLIRCGGCSAVTWAPVPG